MTDDRFPPRLSVLMHELAAGDERYIDDVLARTAQTRQRPAWSFGSHWLPAPAALQSLPAYRNRLMVVFLIVAMLSLLLASAAFFGARRPALPRLDASNGWIAVAAFQPPGPSNHFGDIYLLRDGAPARRIIGSPGDGLAQACPRFSPDGGRLAYGEADDHSTATNERGLWPVANRAVVVVALNHQGDASAPVIRIELPEGAGEIACPEWSPNGTQIAFRVGSQLWIADAKSGNRAVFAATEANWGQNGFEWSRDGSRIAVSEPGDIRVEPVDGSAATVIRTGSNTPGSLGWLAGDQQIVYVHPDAPGDGLSVNVVGIDGSNDTQLTADVALPTQGVIHSAVVSPDGTRIAYTEQTLHCTSDGCAGDPQRLLTMNPDGSGVLDVPVQIEVSPYGLQWSPDGKRLLLGSLGGVASVDATTGSAVLHSNAELDMEWTASELTWQPVYE